MESTLRLAYTGGWPGALWGRLPGTCEVRVIRDTLPIPGLRAPLRLAFASDLLVLGGDYVFLDATPATAETLRRLVASVPARAKVAVLGNHDLWTHHALIEEALAAAGARVLINEGSYLDHPHADVAVVGLDEPWTGQPDGARALESVPEARVRLRAAHELDGLTLYVSRGLGGIEVPVRAWAPPDVLVLDLSPRSS